MAVTKEKVATTEIVCPTCNGAMDVVGRYTQPPIPCPECKGKGVVEVPVKEDAAPVEAAATDA